MVKYVTENFSFIYMIIYLILYDNIQTNDTFNK